jgi:nucleoside 2-deoxyribosyltransferase-like protein
MVRGSSSGHRDPVRSWDWNRLAWGVFGHRGLVVQSVQQSIVKADLIVADITGNNPNTLYELGFAYALRKPVLIVSERGQDLPPFDIRGYVVMQYDPSDRESFQRYILVSAQRYATVEVAAA